MKFLELLSSESNGENVYLESDQEQFFSIPPTSNKKLNHFEIIFFLIVTIPYVLFCAISMWQNTYNALGTAGFYCSTIATGIFSAEIFLWIRKKLLKKQWKQSPKGDQSVDFSPEILAKIKKHQTHLKNNLEFNLLLMLLPCFFDIYLLLVPISYSLWVGIRKMDFFGYRDFMKNQLEKLPEAERAVI